MPAGKGTYGSKVGRPKKKVTKMAEGGLKASDYKEPWMKSLIKEFGLEGGVKAIADVLGTTYRNPKTGMRQAKGGLSVKKKKAKKK